MFDEFIVYNVYRNKIYGIMPIWTIPKMKLWNEYKRGEIILLPYIGLTDIDNKKLYVGDIIVNPILTDKLDLEKYITDHILTYKKEIIVYKKRDDYWYSGFLATDFNFSSYDLIQDSLCERICNITDDINLETLKKINVKELHFRTFKYYFLKFLLKQYGIDSEFLNNLSIQNIPYRKG